MLTKEDYEDYLNQVSRVEIKMAKTYEGLLSRVDDEDLKKLFHNLSHEEYMHDKIVDEIRELINSAIK